ncbi:unnamed protein product, partial [Sphenostylis stenocarpa]
EGRSWKQGEGVKTLTRKQKKRVEERVMGYESPFTDVGGSDDADSGSVLQVRLRLDSIYGSYGFGLLPLTLRFKTLIKMRRVLKIELEWAQSMEEEPMSNAHKPIPLCLLETLRENTQ